MYSEMLFLNIVRNCTHLFVKQKKKKKKILFASENSAVFAQEVESIYLFGNYLLTRYTRLYTLLFGHVTCITL